MKDQNNQPSEVIDLASTLNEIDTSSPVPQVDEVIASNGEPITLGDSGDGMARK